MASPRNCPKYWSAEQQSVVEGLETREGSSTPTQLSDLLGTYVLVYNGCPEFGGDVEEMYRAAFRGDANFIKEYSITLATKATPSKTVAPKAVSGRINWGTFKLPYEGLRRVRERWSTDKSVAWMESRWELLLVDEGYELGGEHWLEAEGNTFGVTKVVDDNGNPFLTFDWSLSGGGHSSWSGYHLGKKMVEGESWRFTDEEKCRLGIGYTFRHVEKSVTGKCEKKYEEDEEEEHSDEEDSDNDEEDEEDDSEDEDSGKEDTGSGDEDANGGSGEEALSEIKAAGGKRKLREDDTGSNKRRCP